MNPEYLEVIDNIKQMVSLWLTQYGLKIVAAILILVLGKIAAKILRSIVDKLLIKSKVDDTLRPFVCNIVYIASMAFVIIAALSKLAIQTASFVAVIGAAGLAVGLALQGSLSNFAAGVLLIIFKPFKVGDFIKAAGVEGVVEQISIFTTELKSTDNKKLIIPNAKLTSDNIINFTAKSTRRVDLVVGVSYSDNLDKVRKVLQEVLDAEERLLKDPAPVIGVLEMADSSVNLVVRPWCNTADYWNVYFALQEAIKKRFDQEDITIPFPQRDVHIYNENDNPMS